MFLIWQSIVHHNFKGIWYTYSMYSVMHPLGCVCVCVCKPLYTDLLFTLYHCPSSHHVQTQYSMCQNLTVVLITKWINSSQMNILSNSQNLWIKRNYKTILERFFLLCTDTKMTLSSRFSSLEKTQSQPAPSASLQMQRIIEKKQQLEEVGFSFVLEIKTYFMNFHTYFNVKPKSLKTKMPGLITVVHWYALDSHEY